MNNTPNEYKNVNKSITLTRTIRVQNINLTKYKILANSFVINLLPTLAKMKTTPESLKGPQR